MQFRLHSQFQVLLWLHGLDRLMQQHRNPRLFFTCNGLYSIKSAYYLWRDKFLATPCLPEVMLNSKSLFSFYIMLLQVLSSLWLKLKQRMVSAFQLITCYSSIKIYYIYILFSNRCQLALPLFLMKIMELLFFDGCLSDLSQTYIINSTETWR